MGYRTLCVAWTLLIVSCASSFGQTLDDAVIPRKTEIFVKIQRSLNSKTARTGDRFHGQVEVPVTVEVIVANLSRNAALSKAILSDVIPRVPEERGCACGSALENAIVTAREVIPPEARERLALLVDKYLQ